MRVDFSCSQIFFDTLPVIVALNIPMIFNLDSKYYFKHKRFQINCTLNYI